MAQTFSTKNLEEHEDSSKEVGINTLKKIIELKNSKTH